MSATATSMAAMAPRMSCPGAPMLKSPPLNPKATASPVKTRGVARRRLWRNPEGFTRGL